MKLKWVAAGLAVLTGAAVSAQIAGGSMSASYARVDGAWTPITALCDGTDADRLHVLSAPDRLQRATLWTFAKPVAGVRTRQVRIGAGEPGAGQIHYPLLDADGLARIGDVHAINPGMVDRATTPTLMAMTLGEERTTCRWVPQTRVLAATPRRTVMITGSPRDGFEYRSYDFGAVLAPVPTAAGHDTRPSLLMVDGQLAERSGQRRTYAFQSGSDVFRVTVSTDPAAPGGMVEVQRGGRTVLTERFEAFTATQRP